ALPGQYALALPLGHDGLLVQHRHGLCLGIQLGAERELLGRARPVALHGHQLEQLRAQVGVGRLAADLRLDGLQVLGQAAFAQRDSGFGHGLGTAQRDGKPARGPKAARRPERGRALARQPTSRFCLISQATRLSAPLPPCSVCSQYCCLTFAAWKAKFTTTDSELSSPDNCTDDTNTSSNVIFVYSTCWPPALHTDNSIRLKCLPLAQCFMTAGAALSIRATTCKSLKLALPAPRPPPL